MGQRFNISAARRNKLVWAWSYYLNLLSLLQYFIGGGLNVLWLLMCVGVYGEFSVCIGAFVRMNGVDELDLGLWGRGDI